MEQTPALHKNVPPLRNPPPTRQDGFVAATSITENVLGEPSCVLREGIVIITVKLRLTLALRLIQHTRDQVCRALNRTRGTKFFANFSEASAHLAARVRGIDKANRFA